MAWRKQSSTSSLMERYGRDWTSVGPDGGPERRRTDSVGGGGGARAESSDRGSSSACTAPPDAGGGPVQRQRGAAAAAASKHAALKADRVITPRKAPCAPPPPPANLADWTVAHVADWVAATPLPLEVSERMRENAINGPVLESLTDEDMISMGLEKFGWRRQLFLSRQELFETMDSDAPGQCVTLSPTHSDSECATEWHQIHSRSPTDKGSPEGDRPSLTQHDMQRLAGHQLERQQLERQRSSASPTPPAPPFIRRPAVPSLPPHERMPLAASGPQAPTRLANTTAPGSLRRFPDGTDSPRKGGSGSTPAPRGVRTPTHPSRAPFAAGAERLHDSAEPTMQPLMSGAGTPSGPPLHHSSNFTPQLSARLSGTASPPVQVSRQVSGIVRRRSPSPPTPLPPPQPPATSKSSASIRVNSPSAHAVSPAPAKASNAAASPRVLVHSPSPRGLPAPAGAEEPAGVRGSLGRRPAVPTSWGMQGSLHAGPGPTSGGSMKVAMLPLQQASPQATPASGGSVSVAMLPLQHGSPQAAPQSGGTGSLAAPQGSPQTAPTFGGSLSVPMLPLQQGSSQMALLPAKGGAQQVVSLSQHGGSVAAPARSGAARAVGAPFLWHGTLTPR